MCGIVGYVGQKDAVNFLIEGLERLEYRGYDSAGIALFNPDIVKDQQLSIRRALGKLFNLKDKLEEEPIQGKLGLGHTRWATHGSPSEMNAHPHWSENVVVVHNGIIENYLELRDRLMGLGVKFSSETDTEVIPHLIEFHWKKMGDLEKAFRTAIGELRGAYAVAMLARDDLQKLYVAKNRSPLVLGRGNNENFLASDIPAILNHTRDIILLEDGDFAILTPMGIEVMDALGKTVDRAPKKITWTYAMAEKGGYRHFMLKEIHEQPTAISQTLQGHINYASQQIDLANTTMTPQLISSLKRIVVIACGTSWHAGLAGKYMLEQLARVPVEVDLASEYRYRQPIVDKETLVVAVSQSGETADTLAALEEVKRLGAPVLAISNVLDSSIPRAANHTLYTHAGPEIGVASTKAFTSQLVAFYLLAVEIAKQRKQITSDRCAELIQDVINLPGKLEETLALDEEVLALAQRFFQYSDFLYLGRGLGYPIALEGALKLKEISYIHAEGYPAGEMKHGPIALIDDKMPVLVVGSDKVTFEKTLANLAEVRTRGGITILCVSDHQYTSLASKPETDYLLLTPSTNDYLLPIVQTIPLQLLSYHIAVLRGTDVDQPRNLAKSVTVE